MPLGIDLAGRVAVVTGAGAGIGRACAQKLAEAGASPLVLIDVREEPARETAEMVGALGAEGRVAVVDVGDPAQIAAGIPAALDGLGQVGVLVNNAGFDYWGRVADTPLEDWERVQAVHLRGMFLMVKACLSVFAEDSSVVNIASVHGSMTEDGFTAYASAKAGIIGMTRAMAQDLGPRVRVNAVSPGYIQTRLIDAYLEGTGDPSGTLARVVELHPVGRIGQAEDVANLVAFLCSPLAAFITGQNYTIDGGLTSSLPRPR